MGGAFVVDLFTETIRVQLLGKPTMFIRSILNTGKQLTPEVKHQFEQLREAKELVFIQHDIHREKRNAVKREKRMERLKEEIRYKKWIDENEDSKNDAERVV